MPGADFSLVDARGREDSRRPSASASSPRCARIRSPQSYGVATVTAGGPLPTAAAVLWHTSLTTIAIGAEARELVSRVRTSDQSRTRRGGMTLPAFDALAGERIAALGAPIAGALVVVRLR